MKRWRDLAIPSVVVIVLSVALWWALGISDFLMEDACLDRGGTLEAGRCIGATVQPWSPGLLYLIQLLVAPVMPLIAIVWWWRRRQRMGDA